MSETNQAGQDEATRASADHGTASPPNPLCGVRGWLKFFVVVQIYIVPVIFVLNHILAWIGFSMLADDYPGIIPAGLIETGVGGFLVCKWIQIARRLRDIKPGVVQEAKTWLKIVLGWSILSTPLAFMSGIDAEALLPGAIKGIVISLIAFAILLLLQCLQAGQSYLSRLEQVEAPPNRRMHSTRNSAAVFLAIHPDRRIRK